MRSVSRDREGRHHEAARDPVEHAVAARLKGAEFTIRWPRAKSETATTKMPALQVSEARRLRVLIVDDDPEAAVVLGTMVSALGHDVIIKHDREAALEIAETSGAHVAIVDVGGPRIDGYDLAQRLRMLPASKGTSMIAVMRGGQSSDRERGEQAGFSYHLADPIDAGALQSMLAALKLLPSD